MTQGRFERSAIYASPWRDILPDGSLSPPYGPSPSTLARQRARHEDWAWRPGRGPRNSLHELEPAVFPGGEARLDIPQRELDVFRLLVDENLTRRQAAARMGVSINTVKTLVQRLKRRCH